MLWSVIRVIFKTSLVTPDFFYVLNLILSFSTCSQSFNKICGWEVLGANVLKYIRECLCSGVSKVDCWLPVFSYRHDCLCMNMNAERQYGQLGVGRETSMYHPNLFKSETSCLKVPAWFWEKNRLQVVWIQWRALLFGCFFGFRDICIRMFADSCVLECVLTGILFPPPKAETLWSSISKTSLCSC